MNKRNQPSKRIKIQPRKIKLKRKTSNTKPESRDRSQNEKDKVAVLEGLKTEIERMLKTAKKGSRKRKYSISKQRKNSKSPIVNHRRQRSSYASSSVSRQSPSELKVQTRPSPDNRRILAISNKIKEIAQTNQKGGSKLRKKGRSRSRDCESPSTPRYKYIKNRAKNRQKYRSQWEHPSHHSPSNMKEQKTSFNQKFDSRLCRSNELLQKNNRKLKKDKRHSKARSPQKKTFGGEYMGSFEESQRELDAKKHHRLSHKKKGARRAQQPIIYNIYSKDVKEKILEQLKHNLKINSENESHHRSTSPNLIQFSNKEYDQDSENSTRPRKRSILKNSVSRKNSNSREFLGELAIKNDLQNHSTNYLASQIGQRGSPKLLGRRRKPSLKIETTHQNSLIKSNISEFGELTPIKINPDFNSTGMLPPSLKKSIMDQNGEESSRTQSLHSFQDTSSLNKSRRKVRFSNKVEVREMDVNTSGIGRESVEIDLRWNNSKNNNNNQNISQFGSSCSISPICPRKEFKRKNSSPSPLRKTERSNSIKRVAIRLDEREDAKKSSKIRNKGSGVKSSNEYGLKGSLKLFLSKGCKKYEKMDKFRYRRNTEGNKNHKKTSSPLVGEYASGVHSSRIKPTMKVIKDVFWKKSSLGSAGRPKRQSPTKNHTGYQLKKFEVKKSENSLERFKSSTSLKEMMKNLGQERQLKQKKHYTPTNKFARRIHQKKRKLGQSTSISPPQSNKTPKRVIINKESSGEKSKKNKLKKLKKLEPKKKPAMFGLKNVLMGQQSPKNSSNILQMFAKNDDKLRPKILTRKHLGRVVANLVQIKQRSQPASEEQKNNPEETPERQKLPIPPKIAPIEIREFNPVETTNHAKYDLIANLDSSSRGLESERGTESTPTINLKKERFRKFKKRKRGRLNSPGDLDRGQLDDISMISEQDIPRIELDYDPEESDEVKTDRTRPVAGLRRIVIKEKHCEKKNKLRALDLDSGKQIKSKKVRKGKGKTSKHSIGDKEKERDLEVNENSSKQEKDTSSDFVEESGSQATQKKRKAYSEDSLF